MREGIDGKGTKVLFRHFPDVTEKNRGKSVRMVGHRYRIQDLPKARPKHYQPSYKHSELPLDFKDKYRALV